MARTRAFVVRPFGTKGGIDFDRVERELIGPVLEGLAIEGRTTEELVRAGNIRTDMFERLLVADLVIADISVHNANVYYELGVRHALRPRTTILIRARADVVPFDLRTDRYVVYDEQAPAAAAEALSRAVAQSLAAEGVDSPVFLLLPTLEASDPDHFHPVPTEFSQAVRAAERAGDAPMLAVLGEEAEGFDWDLSALRLVGEAQFRLGVWIDARATWAAIRERRRDDPQADLRLGTVLQRLADPAGSTAAIERVIDRPELTADQFAEALALLARNAKERWVAEWTDAPSRAAAALRSPFLETALGHYDDAFSADQNHWYSGINALALVTVRLRLAAADPQTWAEPYETEDDAVRAADALERTRCDLVAAVRRSLAAEAFRGARRGEHDVWADLSRAELALLTERKPTFVAAAYERARARLSELGAPHFPAESAARQLRLYLGLGVFAPQATAALEALGASVQPPVAPPRPRVLVFAGHRVDAPDRAQARFPAASEPAAAALIRETVAAEQRRAADQPIEGIAGGASGGDILFHEICAELGIPTQLLLAIAKDRFAAASVLDAGPDWMQRFRALTDRLDTKILSQSSELPAWLRTREDYGIWARNNRWILHTALSRADADVTLVVLWDGKGGDGPGGTRDMLELAQARGVRVVRLDASGLSGA